MSINKSALIPDRLMQELPDFAGSGRSAILALALTKWLKSPSAYARFREPNTNLVFFLPEDLVAGCEATNMTYADCFVFALENLVEWLKGES